ncbi:MAG TPA: cyclic nucleotide-binding domain-containing protein [Mycobacteriales bacterium]|nr:cyclic nucleotide-binding domain-containing protein [Mycobacteriales bacterium]
MSVHTDQGLSTALRGTELFRELSDKEIKTVARQMQVITHEAGEVITTEGRAGVGFHLVLSGTAVVDREDREPVRVHPGDYFGEISLLDGGPRTATVRAETDLETAVLAPWDFAPVLLEHPAMAVALLRGLCARLRATESVPQPRASD